MVYRCLPAWAGNAGVSALGVGGLWGESKAEGFPLRGAEAQGGWTHGVAPHLGPPGQLCGGQSRWTVSPRGSKWTVGMQPGKAPVPRGVKPAALLLWDGLPEPQHPPSRRSFRAWGPVLGSAFGLKRFLSGKRKWNSGRLSCEEDICLLIRWLLTVSMASSYCTMQTFLNKASP